MTHTPGGRSRSTKLNLEKWIKSSRYTVLICLAFSVGIGYYILHTADDNHAIVLTIRFIVMMAMSGGLALLTLASLLSRYILRRRLYASTRAGVSPQAFAHRACGLTGAIFRAVLVFLLANGLLYGSIDAMVRRDRSIYPLATVEEAQMDQWEENMNPKNLFKCPWRQDKLAQVLCELDRTMIILYVVIGFAAVVESVVTFMYEATPRMEEKSQVLDLGEIGGHSAAPLSVAAAAHPSFSSSPAFGIPGYEEKEYSYSSDFKGDSKSKE